MKERHLTTNPAGKQTKVSPCALRLLTPTLSSFGEEREKAGAAFKVQGFNPSPVDKFQSSLQKGGETSSWSCLKLFVNA